MRTSVVKIFLIAIFVVPAFHLFAQDTPVDMSVIEGDYSASIKVLRVDGTSAAGEPYVLELDAKGPDPKITSGVIPKDGVVRMKGYAGGPEGPTYQLVVGKYLLEADRFQLSGTTKHQELTITMTPAPGDQAPDIPMQDLFSGKMRKLSEFKGQIIYLDFWASWCKPCQIPMEHGERTMRKHGEDWKGKVAFVELSMNDTPEEAREHVKYYNWKSMDHFWSSEGEPGFFSDAPRVYGVDSIPTALLIDASGKVVWRGDPNDVDVEKEIERLLKRAKP